MTAGPTDSAARVADAQAQLAATPQPRAAGPGPGAKELRGAYLELLKLALCDLTGTATSSVGATEDGGVLSRELRGDATRLRAAGMDWPLHGLTMVGLRRLDDLQRCVESVVTDRIDGDLIEAGAWRGGASMLMRATLDTLGDDRTVVAADSFQGFPEVDEADTHAGRLSAFAFLGVPVEEVRRSMERLGLERGLELVPGFFEDTLPGLAARRWAIVRLDADSHEATQLALRCLYPGLAVGGYLIVDDYGSFDGCRQAVDEFRAEHGIVDPLEPIDHTGVRWRRTGDALVEIDVPPPAATRRPAVTHPAAVEVPTAREVELSERVAELEERLRAAHEQIGLRPWLRRRLGR
jgi:O-methyltransferase